MKTAAVRVNNLLHQAVNKVVNGLRIVAPDHNHLVQAIEQAGDRHRLGVQWHPEYLPWQRNQQQLLQALVTAART